MQAPTEAPPESRASRLGGPPRFMIDPREYLLPKRSRHEGPLPYPVLSTTEWSRVGEGPPIHWRIDREGSPTTWRYNCDAIVCAGHLMVEAPRSLSVKPLLVYKSPRCFASAEEREECERQFANMSPDRVQYIKQFTDPMPVMDAATACDRATWWVNNAGADFVPPDHDGVVDGKPFFARPALPSGLLERAQPIPEFEQSSQLVMQFGMSDTVVNGQFHRSSVAQQGQLSTPQALNIRQSGQPLGAPAVQPAIPMSMSRPGTMINGQSRGRSDVQQGQLSTPQSLNIRPEPTTGTNNSNGQAFGASAVQPTRLARPQMQSRTSMPPPGWRPQSRTPINPPEAAYHPRKRQRVAEPQDGRALHADPVPQQQQQQQQQPPAPVSLPKMTPSIDLVIQRLEWDWDAAATAVARATVMREYFNFDAAALPAENESLQGPTVAADVKDVWCEQGASSAADDQLSASSSDVSPVPQQRWCPGEQTAIVDDDEGLQGPSFAADGVQNATKVEPEQGAVLMATDNGLSKWSSLFEAPSEEQTVSSERVPSEEQPRPEEKPRRNGKEPLRPDGQPSSGYQIPPGYQWASEVQTADEDQPLPSERTGIDDPFEERRVPGLARDVQADIARIRSQA